MYEPKIVVLYRLNCYITPNTIEARTRIMHKVYGNIKAFLETNSINVLTKSIFITLS
ncbi:hypothetical protein [Brachyspira sp.]|uniref:hypothetical protein n=1 Tax=Brachyspira sp. TaxID=1977261 RepID=UPI002629A8A6|nr:hypothetical protein [Brachyspira sp.]